MNMEQFRRILDELFGGNVVLSTLNNGVPKKVRIYEIKGEDAHFEEITPTQENTIAHVKVNNSIVMSIGLKDGKFVVNVSKDFVERASDATIYRALSIVPLVATEIAEKIPEEEASDVLVGVGRLLGIDSRIRDPTRPVRRVLKKVTRNVVFDTDSYKKGFNDAFSVYKRLLRGGWRIIDWKKGKALRYDGVINVEVIRENGEFYIVPEDKKGQLYVKGITVPLTETIEKIYVDKHMHPNINNGVMCLGEGKGMPLKDILVVISLLKTANLDSPYGDKAQMIARMIVNEVKERQGSAVHIEF